MPRLPSMFVDEPSCVKIRSDCSRSGRTTPASALTVRAHASPPMPPTSLSRRSSEATPAWMRSQDTFAASLRHTRNVDIGPWRYRMQVVDASCDGAWELPVMATSTLPWPC